MVRRPRGFSFIELLVVLTLFGLIMGFVVLRLDDMVPSARLAGTARRLATTVGVVRGEAIASGRVHGILYDVTYQRFAILAPPSPEDIEAGTAKPGDLERLEWEVMPPGVEMLWVGLGDRTVSHGTVTTRAHPLGIATAHAVCFRGREGGEMTVTVNPVTGLVELLVGAVKLDLFAEASEFGGGLSGSDF